MFAPLQDLEGTSDAWLRPVLASTERSPPFSVWRNALCRVHAPPVGKAVTERGSPFLFPPQDFSGTATPATTLVHQSRKG
ncbi:MAG: hypothetical protein KatS3mg105_2893 [Gemmatales bacterium]|nr:MAG: hypothetical protein KatS3mg105_2893 [Gemmatales bacterium]